jgi:hypothetical protein
MARETTYAGQLGDLQRFKAALEANIAEVPHLQGTLERVGVLLAQGQETANRQLALAASKQETSKQLKTLVTEGQRVATAARALLKEHYGLRSEKLAEFGVQPFRGRNRASKKKTPAQEQPTAPTVPPQPGS